MVYNIIAKEEEFINSPICDYKEHREDACICNSLLKALAHPKLRVAIECQKVH